MGREVKHGARGYTWGERFNMGRDANHADEKLDLEREVRPGVRGQTWSEIQDMEQDEL